MFDLFVYDNIFIEFVVFIMVDVSKVKLFFDIVFIYFGNNENKVGCGVVLFLSV